MIDDNLEQQMNEIMSELEGPENFLKPLFIMERFASAFRDKSEINKTELQLLTKLRWNLLSKYVNLLVSKGFLLRRKTPKMIMYTMTERGRKFFSIVMICLGCLK